MFDTTGPYRFVQRNRNQNRDKSYLFEYIYVFFVTNKRNSSKRKYILKIREYEPDFFRIDFYAKLPRKCLKPKYRYYTQQRAGGKVGGMILTIIEREFLHKYSMSNFGFVAAEQDDQILNKRFSTYVTLLKRIRLAEKFDLIFFKEKSFIFVLRKLQKNGEENEKAGRFSRFLEEDL